MAARATLAQAVQLGLSTDQIAEYIRVKPAAAQAALDAASGGGVRFGRSPVRAGRRDANEAEIVAALIESGAAVVQLDPPLPDLLVSYRGRLMLIEVKDHRRRAADPGRLSAAVRRNHDGQLPPSLTPQQVAWWRAWLANGGPAPALVMDAAEALVAIGAPAAP